GLYGESEAGGYWGAELKSAGWDGIIFTGKAEKPVYLWIKDDAVEIRDAAHLWGKITGDVEAELRDELGDNRVRVTQIGPAGENLVRFACVVNDLNEFAGRAGMGAVMGSKNLKAIAVRGSTRPQPADMEPLKRTAQWVARDTFAEGQPHYIFHEYGTGAMVKSKQLEGHVISHNFRDGVLEGAENSDAISIKENVTERMDGCYSCSVNCKKRVRIETAKMTVDPKYGGPEYETLAAIGSNLGVTDIMAVCKSAEMVNYLGLDSISAGSVLAWAMEMAEMGVISPEDLGGEELTFGRGADVLRWIEMIAYRKGFGDVLAEGATHAARKIGQDSGKYVMAVKGIDLGMHDPRAMENMRRQFAVAPVGGDHCGSAHKRNSLANTLGICQFLDYDDELKLELLNAATGWDMTLQ
ncbi:MAG TPA: aldehyde ferredoxin oxidoreductase C-terminal domain-containing protein, partial [Chloroflexota bacterium]|nr:aldehyde ferredoxin oxidoreductase C-terminal domain-containing protein [Chloroflexota bacterium]